MQGNTVNHDIRTDLGVRIAALAMRGRAADLAVELDSIRHIAAANGLLAVVAVAHALESAVARGERGPLVQGWLTVLNDAVGSDRQDKALGELFASACGVRFAS
jgi:hypothetical protein